MHTPHGFWAVQVNIKCSQCDFAPKQSVVLLSSRLSIQSLMPFNYSTSISRLGSIFVVLCSGNIWISTIPHRFVVRLSGVQSVKTKEILSGRSLNLQTLARKLVHVNWFVSFQVKCQKGCRRLNPNHFRCCRCADNSRNAVMFIHFLARLARNRRAKVDKHHPQMVF